MKQLLSDIRDRLRIQITYLENASIHILIDSDLLPQTSQLPAIGLKDGEEVFDLDLGQRRQKRTLIVDISCYASIPRPDTPEASIMGSGTLKGILDMSDDVIVALNGWKLTGSVYRSRPVRSLGSMSLINAQEGQAIRLWAQRKTVVFEFKRQELAF